MIRQAIQQGQDPRSFLDFLFGEEVDKDNQISIFSLPHQAANFFNSVGGAVQFIDTARMRKGVDLYFGVGLYRLGIVKGRGKAEDVTKITTLWSDVDFGPNHKKNVPPTEADARKVLARMRFKPSLIVHSGHGYSGHRVLLESRVHLQGHTLSCLGFILPPVSEE